MRIQMWGSPILTVSQITHFPEEPGRRREFWAVDAKLVPSEADVGGCLEFELYYHHLPEGFVVGRQIGLPGSDTFPKGD